MKAELYVQGHYWASIDIPRDSLLALLAEAMIVHAKRKANQLTQDLENVCGVHCSISLRFKETADHTPGDEL